MFYKRFKDWLFLKESLDLTKHKPPLVSEGDVWWASIGENVGYEISGKSNLFSRPVLILKKLSSSFFLVAPTTRRIKYGSRYSIVSSENINTVCLHQIRAIDYRRLKSKLCELDSKNFNMVKDSFKKLYY